MPRPSFPLLPHWFNFDSKGGYTPDPNFLVSAAETSKSPTTVDFGLNPKAVWGDGSPIDVEDLMASSKACNGQNKKSTTA